jgi:energy-coupling factor transporter ATP-binding protein EcfA2
MNHRSHSRWAPLRGAAWFALGFIALRVIYRVVFLGASGSGIVLWSVRPIHLDGPFRMISLFGPVTTGGLMSSLMDALPFALGILACGLLFSLLDVRRFLALAARARFARGILTALAIGVSTYPALVATWRSMRQIHRLRRERGGFSVLGPLFERTLERAAALGASMEVRGFGRRGDEPELDCSVPLSVRGLGLSHVGVTVFSDATFDLNLGELVLLTGATGSGKSSLLRSIVGLDSGVAAGAMTVGGADRASARIQTTATFVGYVPQNVRESFVATTVRGELAFSLVSQGFFSNAAINVRLREVVAALRLEALLEHPIESLSAGEAVVVALGAALVSRPTLLLLDEPFADLDAQQASHVVALLARLAHTTLMCIVVAEHRIGLVAPLADRRLHIEKGQVNEQIPPREPAPPFTSTPSFEASLITAPMTALVGPNGSGKTTHFFALAEANPTKVALVPEVLADFFVRDTVEAECRRSDHTAKAVPGTTKNLVSQLLSTPIDAEKHPRDLSSGQQMALAIAIALASGCPELLIDEPTRGLDASARANLAQLLRVVGRDHVVTIATHDAEFVRDLNAVTRSMTEAVTA